MSLLDELRQARWFGAKSRVLEDARIVDSACWTDGSALSLVEVSYADGPPDTYVLAGSLDDPKVGRSLLQQFRGTSVPTQNGGGLQFRPTHLFASTLEANHLEPIGLLRGEQSNTSLRYGLALVMKLFRRVQYGPNPDVEVGVFLTERTNFRGSPGVVGTLEYVAPDGQQASLAFLQQFVANRGDAWTTTLERLQTILAGGDPAESLAAVARLAQITAELHLALADGSGDPAFRVEPITPADVAEWRTAMQHDVDQALAALAARGIHPDSTDLARRSDGLQTLVGAEKTRHHGDYHLGQVLEREDGSFMIIDFEGEPTKPLALRRERRSPLRDVAGMLRSLDYARHAAVRAGDASTTTRRERADAWYHAAHRAFQTTYVATVASRRPALLPADVSAALGALELEKAAYEVLYELNNRPDWLPIPLAAFTSA